MSLRIRSSAFGLILVLVGASPAAAAMEDAAGFRPLSEPTWLRSQQRLCFGIDEQNLDEALRSGTNVICGGTNAAGIGFAGGPFILGQDDEIVDIRSGQRVPDETLRAIRSRVDRAHARGAKVLGEAIRFYMTPWIQAEHPD